MNSWDDFIWFITNPFIIAIFVIGLALDPIIKYARRFYPEAHKKAAMDDENFIKGLEENKEDKTIYINSNFKIIYFIFGPPFVLFIMYVTYGFYIELEFKVQSIGTEFYNIAPLVIVMLGIYTIKTDKVHKFLFKDTYKKVMELADKQSGNDPLLKKYDRYAPIVGWFFLLIGTIGLIMGFLNKLV